MTYPVDVAINPNNQAQRYILWGNGRIDNLGGAVPILDGPKWFDRLDQPVGVAIWITNWTTGAGYVLDVAGGFQAFGGAPTITTASGDTWANNNGLPYTNVRTYVGWSWDPAGSGQGYAIDFWGQIWPFGGAPPAPRTGPRFGSPAVKGFEMQWTPTKKAYTLDLFGAVWLDWAAVAPNPVARYFAPTDVARDLAITNWTTGAGYVLTADGAVHSFGGASSSLFGGPYLPGTDVARVLKVLNATNPTRFYQVWYTGQDFEYVASDPPTVLAGGGVTEAQRVTITGAPTGGTIQLTFNGQQTGTIAWNATAATVQTALQALSTIGAGNVTVTGGPGPGTAWTITFTGTLAVTDVAQMTATSALTGGTAPAVAVTTITGGITASPASTITTTTRPMLTWAYSDPQNDSQDAWELFVYTHAFVDTFTITAEDGSVVSNPLTFYGPQSGAASALVAESGVNPSTRGIESPVDLPNGSFRMYVRAKDTSGQWSAWSTRGWTQNVPVPATPTGLTATPSTATEALVNTTGELAASAYTVALSVNAAAGSGTLVRFEFSDDLGATWASVRGADAVTRAATTTATDRDIPLNVTRTYRAVVYSVNPRTASAPSTTATARIDREGYVLTSTADATLGGRVRVQEPVEWTRPIVSGIFQPLGADYPIVVSDGTPKGRRVPLRLFTRDRAAWRRVATLMESDSTLVFRDPFGEVIYCRPVGDWSRALQKSGGNEPGGLAHMHTTEISLVEVAPPTAGV